MVFLSYLDIMPFLHKGNNWVYNAYENLILFVITTVISRYDAPRWQKKI